MTTARQITYDTCRSAQLRFDGFECLHSILALHGPGALVALQVHNPYATSSVERGGGCRGIILQCETSFGGIVRNGGVLIETSQPRAVDYRVAKATIRVITLAIRKVSARRAA